MTDRVADWLDLLGDLYPAADAQTWDSVGLQVGDPDADVDGVLVCLDVTEATLNEAAEVGAGLVLAHHPLFFRPLDRLTPATAVGRIALRAANKGLAVAAAHTNFDAAVAGTTAPVMRILGIDAAEPLARLSGEEQRVKIVVFTPADATAVVLSAAFGGGAGTIGEYDECSFRVSGTGTFRPSAAANPAVGERDQRNDVAEERIEVVVAHSRLRGVIDAIRAAHPYEEVALDVYPLLTAASDAVGKGLGRIGNLAQPRRVGDIASQLRRELPSPHLRLAGDPDRMVSRVAACGGAGDSLISAAVAGGADLYITGDLRHHVTLDAMALGLSLIDAGHYATEAPALRFLIDALEQAARRRGLTARLLASAISTDPWSTTPHQEERQG